MRSKSLAAYELAMEYCGGKKCWSKGRAEKVKRAVMKARNRRIRIYECKCGYWHLTSDLPKKI